ncbi:MAG TPA: hypothetical protein VMF06_18705 [Candidatus Limnocylindria bacterium]|nr:hypothetical protein [Candidatus Limnocylindria bacterium]
MSLRSHFDAVHDSLRYTPFRFVTDVMNESTNSSPSKALPERRWRRWMRRIFIAVATLASVVILLTLIWLRHALYHRWVQFPRQETAWENLRAMRQPVTDKGGWNEYRGILHSHSHFSHDSEMSFEGILQAMDVARLDFICLSDHCVNGRGDFNWQWRGLHQGKLFVPGFEMNDGFMPFGCAPGTIVSHQTPGPELARQIVNAGGVLFYAHPEEPRDWARSELTGMEIYNLHADFKRVPGGLGALLPEVIVNLRAHPDSIYRLMFRRPTEFLRHWDELNQSRHITGIAGNDCHQNVGFRAFYQTNGTIRIEDTSPKTLAEYKLNGFTRLLARVALGPLEPGRKLFHVQLDPYERSARYVNTHVLARELSEPALLDALRAGRVFIGFDMVADSSSFRWLARDGTSVTPMGESASLTPATRLEASAPIPCRFTVLKDGQQVHQAEGRSLLWTPVGPGKYRVEAELKVLDEWVPWVYANPIRLN